VNGELLAVVLATAPLPAPTLGPAVGLTTAPLAAPTTAALTTPTTFVPFLQPAVPMPYNQPGAPWSQPPASPTPPPAPPLPPPPSGAMRQLDEESQARRLVQGELYRARKRLLLETDEWRFGSRAERKERLRALNLEYRQREQWLSDDYMQKREGLLKLEREGG
jgi:hypothetical protein